MTVAHEQQGQDWRARAACRGEDPELFFPLSECGPAAQQQIAEAKSVCGRCPVASECVADAFDRGEPFGVRGGLTPAERRALRATGSAR